MAFLRRPCRPCPRAVALRVDAPGAEIRAEPFRGNRLVALAGKLPNFIKVLPGVLLPFESFDPLGLRFLANRGHCFSFARPGCPENKKAHPPSSGMWALLSQSWVIRLLLRARPTARRHVDVATTDARVLAAELHLNLGSRGLLKSPASHQKESMPELVLFCQDDKFLSQS